MHGLFPHCNRLQWQNIVAAVTVMEMNLGGTVEEEETFGATGRF